MDGLELTSLVDYQEVEVEVEVAAGLGAGKAQCCQGSAGHEYGPLSLVVVETAIANQATARPEESESWDPVETQIFQLTFLLLGASSYVS